MATPAALAAAFDAAVAQAEAALHPNRHDYRAGLRENQCPPDGDWSIWLIMAGRGFGKTHAGVRWLLSEATANPGEYAMIAPTFTDVRKLCVEGESGLLKAVAADDLIGYHKTKWEIHLANGSIIHMLSADQPDRVRGYNFRGAWCDELGAWRYPETWYDGLIPALRIGEHPRVVVTTTPRSTKLLRDLYGRTDGTVKITRGSTWDNAANLSPVSLAQYRMWEGTTRGRQELHGELLEDMPGAKWQRPWIEDHRVTEHPELTRVIVGVDPSGNSGKGGKNKGDETGIVVVGIAADGQIYVLDDASLEASPDEWAKAVAKAYELHSADRVVAEKNFGGAMVEHTLRMAAPDLPIKMVTASRGKVIRAEPVAALYEQGRVHHVGAFPELEDQMTQWESSNPDSPDRMDALVWAITELTGGASGTAFLAAMRAEALERGLTIALPAGPTDWRAEAAKLHAARSEAPRARIFAPSTRADQES